MALNTARTVRTRGLSTAQDNPLLARTARLAQTLQIVFLSVKEYRRQDGVVLSQPLEQCPSRKT